jgi:catechol 2,3-dioxygenase-like lactoylglutathione lyase family enzyme
MAIHLNHTIVPAKDKEASARFFAHVMGLTYEGASGHFAPVRVDDNLTMDFDSREDFEHHHYAFQVSEKEFDQIFGRIKESGTTFGSQPFAQSNGEVNHRRGGRGVYFADPNGHSLELLTHP